MYWGEFISSMEELADDELWVTSGVFSSNDFRRMLDVEFISELAIGILHGPQNKKASLDRWYRTYEAEFGQRSEAEQVFTVVTGARFVAPRHQDDEVAANFRLLHAVHYLRGPRRGPATDSERARRGSKAVAHLW
jgi:hypothetical protein